VDSNLVLLYKLDSGDPDFLDSFYPLARIREACRMRAIELDVVLASEAEADFGSLREKARGCRVWLRGNHSEEMLALLKRSGIDCFNDPEAISRVRDKLWLDGFLSSRGVPRPSRLDPADRAGLAANLPFIVKPRRGMMGRGVRLVESEAELDDLLSALGDDLIFQEYLCESRGRDCRVFVCRGRVLATVRRESDGLTSNIHSGGKAFPIQLAPRWTSLAVDLARDAGLEYAAVDFLVGGPEEFVVCEINTVPGFEASEKASGVDIAGSIIDLCLGDRCAGR
jgi:RimK family alpha-L-glutamate ligase